MRLEDIPKDAQLRLGDRLETLGVTDPDQKRILTVWAWESAYGAPRSTETALHLCESVVGMLAAYNAAPKAADIADAMASMDTLTDGDGDTYIVVAEVTIRKLIDPDGTAAILIDYDSTLSSSDVYGLLALEAARVKRDYLAQSFDNDDECEH